MQELFSRGIPGATPGSQQPNWARSPRVMEVLKLKKYGKWGSGGTPDREIKRIIGVELFLG